LSFSWTWEDFLTPLVYLNEATLDTISVALRSSPGSLERHRRRGAIFRQVGPLVPVLVVCVAFSRNLVTWGLTG
jgi:multiple sugar transport system permease protein